MKPLERSHSPSPSVRLSAKRASTKPLNKQKNRTPTRPTIIAVRRALAV
jgi:hypothetical protein